ncbi:hypothetical protein MTO96_011968 [Rhipicephalus appendiculatus]
MLLASQFDAVDGEPPLERSAVGPHRAADLSLRRKREGASHRLHSWPAVLCARHSQRSPPFCAFSSRLSLALAWRALRNEFPVVSPADAATVRLRAAPRHGNETAWPFPMSGKFRDLAPMKGSSHRPAAPQLACGGCWRALPIEDHCLTVLDASGLSWRCFSMASFSFTMCHTTS